MMHFSTKVDTTLHKMPKDEDLENSSSSCLKTWLSKYHRQYPLLRSSLPKSSGTPSRSSGVKELETSTAHRGSSIVKSTDEVNAALELDIVQSRLCPYPLLIDVKEKDKLCKIAKNVRSSDEYNQMVEGLREDSTNQDYPVEEKFMAQKVVKVLNVILANIGSNDISHQFVNLENKTVSFRDDPPDPRRTTFVTKPDVTLVPRMTTPEPNCWRDVTAAIELKVHSSKDLSNESLFQISRYTLAMIYCRPVLAVNFTMTITGNIARIYRYDAQSFCFTEGALITDPEGFKTFCKYIAFMAHPDRQNECFRPGNEFQVNHCDGSVKQYETVEGNFRVLFSRLRLFGSRTACFSAQVHEVITIDRPTRSSKNKTLIDKTQIPIIIKVSWLAPKLKEHELNVLQHLQSHEGFSSSQSLLKVPQPLGTLYGMDQAFLNACTMSKARPQLPREEEIPLQCVSLVTVCPEGTELDGKSSVLEIVLVFKKLAEILLDVAKADIQYRDFNLGNILRTGDSDSPDCLLIDFGNARIGLNSRGHSDTSDPDTITEVAQDDFRSCTEAFSSIASMKARQLSQDLRGYERDLQKAKAKGNQRFIAKAEGAIKESREDLISCVLHHFDDLQSAFFVFLYVLGEKSIQPKEILRDLAAKQKLLFRGLTNTTWFEFQPSVDEVIVSLVIELIEIVSPKNRLRVLAESKTTQGPPRLTKTEEECFSNWIDAFEDSITRLLKLKDEGEMV